MPPHYIFQRPLVPDNASPLDTMNPIQIERLDASILFELAACESRPIEAAACILGMECNPIAKQLLLDYIQQR